MEPKDLKKPEEIREELSAGIENEKEVQKDENKAPNPEKEVPEAGQLPEEASEEPVVNEEKTAETESKAEDTPAMKAEIPDTEQSPDAEKEKPAQKIEENTAVTGQLTSAVEPDAVAETPKADEPTDVSTQTASPKEPDSVAETPMADEPTEVSGQTTSPEKQDSVAETPKADEPAEVLGTEKADVHVGEPDKVAAMAAESKEKSGGKEAEKPVQKIKVTKKESIDYTKYTAVELVNALRDVLENPEGVELKNEIDAIKSAFYKQLNESIEQAKKEFIEAGGAEEEFEPEEDPYEQDIKNLFKKYRQIRIEYNRQLDQEKEENLKKKYEVIEKIKGLINNEESINRTFNEFRDLQREWREIGLVPQSKMKNLWDTYHFHVENFYDYIKINRELRDLDLKKNLETKIGLCEKAEELLLEPNILKAFKQLQKYHDAWREAGPVPRENKDDIWNRFKSVTAKINKKHQQYFESRKADQKKNLEAKIALCEKVEEIVAGEIVHYREWDAKSKELVKLQKVWRTIGFAPKKDNTKIYDRFRNACDDFFNRKREFYSKNKELQQNNLQQKIDLCVQAESLKDSDDWKKTTQDFIKIQKEWKEVGPVPRKQSDALWNRFRTACDFFFDRKSEHFSGMDSEQTDNLKQKKDLIDEVVNFKSTGDVDENLKALKNFQRRWTEIGHVPFKKKDDIQNRFRDAINVLYDQLNINDEKRDLLKFKSKISSYSESNRGQNKMRMEREKYLNKLKQLESDLILLDNNIGFFANTKNAESLIEDVKQKIEDSKHKIEVLKEKIRVIDDMENEM